MDECLQENENNCAGEVLLRESLTGTGMCIARCEKHWIDRLNLEDRLRQDYPDSPHAPDWFDPMNAGETWDIDA